MGGRSSSVPLRERLRIALTAAMKARDATAVATLRATLGAIDNAEAVEPSPVVEAGDSPIANAVDGLGAGDVPRRDLTEQVITDIVRSEISERTAASDDYARAGQVDRATRLRDEVAVLTAFLDGT
jgi:uncharacterized protein